MALASDPVYGVPPRAELWPSNQDNTRLTTRGQQSLLRLEGTRACGGRKGSYLLSTSYGPAPGQALCRTTFVFQGPWEDVILIPVLQIRILWFREVRGAGGRTLSKVNK